jgi:hypothetical protein
MTDGMDVVAQAIKDAKQDYGAGWNRLGTNQREDAVAHQVLRRLFIESHVENRTVGLNGLLMDEVQDALLDYSMSLLRERV